MVKMPGWPKIFGLLLLSSLAFGQGVIVAPQPALKVNSNGTTSPLASAIITVCAAGNVQVPCNPPLANAVFKDSALTQALGNPFNADLNGNYQFAIAPGLYTVTVTGAGFAGYSYQLTASPVPASPNTWTATNTFNGTTALSGGGSLAGTFSGNPAFTGLPTFANSSSSQSVALATTANAGSTATISCSGSATCSPDYGLLVLSPSGTGIASGDQATVTWSTAADHVRICVFNTYDTTAAATITTGIQDVVTGSTTTKWTFYSTTALTTAHVYNVYYVCR